MPGHRPHCTPGWKLRRRGGRIQGRDGERQFRWGCVAGWPFRATERPVNGRRLDTSLQAEAGADRRARIWGSWRRARQPASGPTRSSRPHRSQCRVMTTCSWAYAETQVKQRLAHWLRICRGRHVRALLARRRCVGPRSGCRLCRHRGLLGSYPSYSRGLGRATTELPHHRCVRRGRWYRNVCPWRHARVVCSRCSMCVRLVGVICVLSSGIRLSSRRIASGDC